MGVKLLVVLTNNHDEKIILPIVALKLHFGQRIILLLPLELNHGLNEPLSYKNDRRKKTFRITTPRCQLKRYGLWSHCPVQCPHVQFNWDNLNAGINFLMSEGSGSQPFIFRPHNQTTPFQNYESLNKRKCFCASSEEQKTKKDHHVCRCLNFCPNSSEEKKKSHHVRRCPNFRPKSSEEQKKSVITSSGRVFRGYKFLWSCVISAEYVNNV